MTGQRLTKWLIVGLATGVVLFVIARASGLPLGYHSDGTAHLRLSWSARPARIEVCRALSEEELERREEHMRQRVECEGRFATYALQVVVDGRRLDEVVVRGSGLRHDRPIHLLRDFDVAGGTHHVRISFTRRERTDSESEAVAPRAALGADTGIFAGRSEREAAERTRRARAAVPARLVLDTSMTFVPGRVVIVTFDAARRGLVALHDE